MSTSLISTRNKAWLALLLFIPAPSVGVWLALYQQQNSAGAVLWLLAKLWLFLGPLLWLIWVDGSSIRYRSPSRSGLVSGLLLGLLMLAIIWGGYFVFIQDNLDITNLQLRLAAVGVNSLSYYLLLSCYWSCINSLLEEYVFRFFIFRQAEQASSSASLAVAITAAGFTLHHSLALAPFLGLWQNLLASLAVFTASIIWSWLYAHYRSIWPGYICHMLADIAIFSIGGVILFG